MGALQGYVVHNHVSGDECEVVIVLEDDSTDYTQVIQGNLLRRGVLGVLDSGARDNLVYWSTATTDDNTWHFKEECPYN